MSLIEILRELPFGKTANLVTCMSYFIGLKHPFLIGGKKSYSYNIRINPHEIRFNQTVGKFKFPIWVEDTFGGHHLIIYHVFHYLGYQPLSEIHKGS